MGTYYDLKHRKELFERGTKKDPHHLSVEKITDLLNCENCAEIESIFYYSWLKEMPIPFTSLPIDYSKFPNLEELTFNFPVPWDYIASLDIPQLRRLTFSVEGRNTINKLRFKHLTEIDINFRHLYQFDVEDEQAIRQKYDFSGIPNVHVVRLKYAEWFDYSSLECCKEIRSLLVQDKGLEDLAWLKNLPRLRALTIFGNVCDLTNIIEYQPDIKTLNISHNRIKELAGLLDMKNLSYVNAYANPLIDGKEFQKVFRGQCYLDEDDRIKESIRNTVDRLIILTFNQIDHYESNYSKLRPYVQKRFDYYRTLGGNKLLECFLQEIFESDFYMSTSPKRIDGQYYSPDYKEYYLDYAQEIYPYLNITSKMRKAVIRSHVNVVEKFKYDSNHLFFIGDDFYVIEAFVKAGTGNLTMTYSYDVLDREQVLKLVNSKWNDVIPSYNIQEYDYDVRVTGLYGNYGDPGLAFPIMLLIRSILEGRTIKEKVAVCEMIVLQDETSYSAKQDAFRILRLAELQKIDTIIVLARDEAEAAGCFPIDNEKVIISSDFSDAMNELTEEEYLKDVGYFYDDLKKRKDL